MKQEHALLVPRVKCIESYPNCIFRVGDLIPLEYDTTFNDYSYIDCGNHILLSVFRKHPAVFKVMDWMDWWMERKEEEMPEYVKHIDGTILKVKEHFIDRFSNYFLIEGFHRNRNELSYRLTMPSTESEILTTNKMD